MPAIGGILMELAETTCGKARRRCRISSTTCACDAGLPGSSTMRTVRTRSELKAELDLMKPEEAADHQPGSDHQYKGYRDLCNNHDLAKTALARRHGTAAVSSEPLTNRDGRKGKPGGCRRAAREPHIG